MRLRNLRAGETLRLELNASQRKKVFALLRLRRARVVCETALDAERLALHVTRP